MSNWTIALGAFVVLVVAAVLWFVLLRCYGGQGAQVQLDAIRTAFEGALFTDKVDFPRAQFTGGVNFKDTGFTGEADFWRTQFTDGVNFGAGLMLGEPIRVTSAAESDSVWPPGWTTRPAKPDKGEDPAFLYLTKVEDGNPSDT